MGTVVPTMIVGTAVPTMIVGTAAKEMFVPTVIVGTVVPAKIVGTAVPTIIVLTAYYWKFCVLVLDTFVRFGLECYFSPISKPRIKKLLLQSVSNINQRVQNQF